MVYREATYVEYLKATKFAKFRYNYGVFIQTIAVILFLILICYTVMNIEEMKANPARYAEKHMDVTCIHNGGLGLGLDNIEINLEGYLDGSG